ncbi:Uroporphyrinogen-III synthase [Methanobacterium lacus]|uniref:Uroporphyrinogen-III synthase n=1 Tax=Methanobacterium lacus (strain AL-21) TaxID=877455 RepID=F0TBZ5_METLA|nr:uroporphyrinogen-III synthase [Methanobacterium lacus]ADZ10337.1 Uroporphyrinogen-III synthase [Methanobacterium lacus]
MKGKEFEGKVIGITRPEERVKEAVAIVEEHGGTALVAPTLELQVSNTQSLIQLCEMAGELDWLIFTSPTGIISVFKHCSDLKTRLNPNCKIAVIGPRTENYLEKKGLKADIVPESYTAEGLLECFEDHDLKNKKIGIPRTLAARDALPTGLKVMGADVFVAEAYKSDLPKDRTRVNQLVEAILNRKINALTFTSTLTVKNLFDMLDETEKQDVVDILKSDDVVVAAIGPVTAMPLHELDIDVLIPEKYTVSAMLEILMGKI